MKKVYAIVIVVLLISFESVAQFKSQTREQYSVIPSITRSDNSGLMFGWFDPNRLFMRQSYTLSYSSFGGHGFSLGVYTNSLFYQIADPLSLQLDVSMVHSPYSSKTMDPYVRTLTGIHLSGVQLTYRPSESMLLQLQYRQLPMHWLNPFNSYDSFFSNPMLQQKEDER